MVNLNAIASPGKVDLSWVMPTKGKKVRVRRSTPPGDPLQTITPANFSGTSYSDTAVKPATEYDYVVVILDRRGNKIDESLRKMAHVPDQPEKPCP